LNWQRSIRVLVALVLGVAFWLFAWPVLGSVITDFIPLPGTNEVSSVAVDHMPDGRWMATVTYFYTGRPEDTHLRFTLLGDPHQPDVRVEYQSYQMRTALKGTHTFAEEIWRPGQQDPVLAKQVLVEMISGPAHTLVASKRITHDLDWPDRTTWDLDREIARTSRDAVLARASALVQAGDTTSLVKARTIVQRLVASGPKFQPAIDLSVRIAEKGIWERGNVDQLRTDSDIAKAVRALWNAGAFPELDELAANLREAKAKTADGLPALDRFHAALTPGRNNLAVTESLLKSDEMGNRRWLRFRPESSTAQLQLAADFIARGWLVRGGGYANSVTDAQFKGFRDWNTKAREVLAQCYPACAQDPQWYPLMLSVMQYLSGDDELYFRTFIEGFERFPDYDRIYETVADRMTPRWGGSVERFGAFAREVASKFPADARDVVYARIYSTIPKFKDTAIKPGFAEWKIDCPRLVRGHDQIVSKYPTEHNFNVAAFMASQCQDRRATRRYLGLVGDKVDMLVWGTTPEESTTAYARAAALAR
jgi:hypothetical protein